MRKSSIELLRIIAMVCIVVCHILNHGLQNSYVQLDWIKPLISCGVDIFVLISGYFGIRFKYKSLANILLMVSFYTIVSCLVEYYIIGNSIPVTRLSGIVLPYSGNHYYWFITCYITLYLFSPVFNEGIEYLRKEGGYYIFIVSLVWINCVGGWLLGNTLINSTGYNFMNFIFLYFIGGSLKFYGIDDLVKFKFLVIFFILTWGISFLLSRIISRVDLFAYNSPTVLMMSIIILLFF